MALIKMLEFDVKKTLFIVVDMVNGFCRTGNLAHPRCGAIVSGIAELASVMQKRGVKTIAFEDSHTPESAEFASFPPHCLSDSSESATVEEIAKYIDYFISKNSTNGALMPGFLDAHVYMGYDCIIVTGVCTDICVLQLCLTLKAEYNRRNLPLILIVPSKLCATYDASWHDGDYYQEAALKIMAGMGIEIVENIDFFQEN